MPETRNIESLYVEINELKSRLRETQDTLDAIRNGEVDAIIVTGQNGDKVFSLASSETPYRIILEEMDEGALTVSSRGIIFYCNQTFSDLISVKLERVIGSDFASFISEEDKPEFKRLLRTALRRSVRGVVTTTVNNKTIHLQLSLSPLPGNMDGEVCIVVSDITELTNYQNYLQEIVDERTEKLKIANRQLSADILRLRKAEKALQRSDERYSLATTAANLGTWEHIYGESGWKIIWSEQMYSIFGLDQGKHIDNESFMQLVHPLDQERVTREYRNIIEKRSPYDIEYRIIRPDNTVRWVHLTGRVTYKEESGEGLRINGIARDITKRKEAEIRIRESEAKYRLLSDTMTQGVIYSDADGKILSVNPAAERIIGKNAEEIVDKKSFELFQEDGSVLPPEDHPLQKTLRTGSPVIGDICLIYNYRDKMYRWINIDTIPLYNKDEKYPDQIYSVFEDITEQRMAEKEIKKREQLFRSAFDEGAVPMTLTSVDGKFLKVNNAFCLLTGYTEEELTGMSFMQITHPDDIEVSFRAAEQPDNPERVPVSIEKRYIRKDGRVVWVNLSTAPVRDESGEFFVTHIQDINKRKNAELRLKESREKFRQLANSIPQLAWIARADGYIIWFNQRWYEYTGRSHEEMRGWGWQDVHDPEILPSVLKEYKESVSTGKPFEMIFPLRGKDGKYREFLTKSIPFMDKKGNVDQWFGTSTDISELKKVENELKDSREKLRIALENGQIGTWEYNLETNEVSWDERTERMFGLEPGTFGGKYDDFLNCIHDEDLPHLKKAFEQAVRSGNVVEAIFRTRPRGKIYNYISAKALITRDSDGRAVNMAGVCFDVTSMKEGAEQALIKMNEELLRSNTDLQQFAYVASHDLQEPLRMVSSFTQLLQQRYAEKLDADANEYIRFAVEGSKRMYDLLNGLLTYSRIQTRANEFRNVDLNQVVAKVKDNLSLVIEENNAAINVTELPVVAGDENQMIQLMQNLIENSLKFRKGPPVIAISSYKAEDSYIISVEDNGIGIEEKYFERIFRIFQRLHRSDQYEGTGIGLAICKRIVERHGGKIWIDSKPGEGSTFHFSIPFRVPPPQPVHSS